MKQNNILKLASLSLIGMGACVAGAQQLFEDFKIEPRETIVGEIYGIRFGEGVSVSGTTIAVGSIRCDEGFGLTGAVFLYDSVTGEELGVVMPNDPQVDHYFGADVVLTETKIVVSAFGDASVAPWSGAVYVFDRATLAQEFKLKSNNPLPNMKFGQDVSVSGDTLIVGERGPYDGAHDAGSAYVFDLQTGTLLHVLKAFNPTTTGNGSDRSDQFGYSVSVDESMGLAIVGAPFANTSVEDSGAAYVFDLNTGSYLSRIESSELQEDEAFGWSTDLEDGRAIIGAPRGGDVVQAYDGSIHLFDLVDPMSPQSGARVACPINVPDDEEFFGHKVVLQGDLAAVSALGESDPGSDEMVFLFDVADIHQPRELIVYRASDGRGSDIFGVSMSIDDTQLVVGASQDWNNGRVCGAVYSFSLPDPNCIADINQDVQLNFFDVSAFLIAYQSQDPIADFNNDGLYDFFDVSAFLTAFNAGCP